MRTPRPLQLAHHRMFLPRILDLHKRLPKVVPRNHQSPIINRILQPFPPILFKLVQVNLPTFRPPKILVNHTRPLVPHSKRSHLDSFLGELLFCGCRERRNSRLRQVDAADSATQRDAGSGVTVRDRGFQRLSANVIEKVIDAFGAELFERGRSRRGFVVEHGVDPEFPEVIAFVLGSGGSDDAEVRDEHLAEC